MVLGVVVLDSHGEGTSSLGISMETGPLFVQYLQQLTLATRRQLMSLSQTQHDNVVMPMTRRDHTGLSLVIYGIMVENITSSPQNHMAVLRSVCHVRNACPHQIRVLWLNDEQFIEFCGEFCTACASRFTIPASLSACASSWCDPRGKLRSRSQRWQSVTHRVDAHVKSASKEGCDQILSERPDSANRLERSLIATSVKTANVTMTRAVAQVVA